MVEEVIRGEMRWLMSVEEQSVTAGSPVWLNGNGAGLFRPLLRDFPPLFFLVWKKFSHDSVAKTVWAILPLSGFTGVTRVW